MPMPKRGTGRGARKRAAEDASGESGSAGGGAGGGTTAATKKSVPGRGSSTVAGKDADGNACLKADNRNLAQGDPTRAVRTATSYFDVGWTEYARKKDGTLEWAPEKIVGIAQDFHKMIDDGKSKTTLYRVRWKGYASRDDTWEPITHLQGFAGMVKDFKDTHEKEMERMAEKKKRDAEREAAQNLQNAPKHTLLPMIGLTSAIWGLGMFQMVSGTSCQCCFRTKQKDPCATSVRHAACTVQGCGFVVKYQNTSNLEAHYTAAGLDHEELSDQLRQHQHLQTQTLLFVGADGSGRQTGKVVAPAFTKAKKGRRGGCTFC